MRVRTVISRRPFRRPASALLCSLSLVCALSAGARGNTGPKTKDADSKGQAGTAASTDAKSGKHLGEQRQLAVQIAFWGESGQTVTDASGTHYCRYSGSVRYEAKVYPPEYWGSFPLYFFNRTTGITVTVRNNGPRRKAKVVIRTEAYGLRTDGTSGYSLKPPQEIEVEVARGETRTIDASFIVFRTPQSESGLNRFLVKVLHANEGVGEPALIAVEEGVFCPPDETPDDPEASPGGDAEGGSEDEVF